MPLTRQMKDLLLQTLEHERGGELVYEAALDCVLNEDLEDEWEDCLERTERHVELLTEACEALGVDPDQMTPTRHVAQHNGNALILAMKMALDAGDPEAAELVACECVVLAESRNEFNWELIGDCAAALNGPEQAVLTDACNEVAGEQDEQLRHTRGWRRRLWLQSLGLDADSPQTA
jgi:hypothetical protein